MKCICFLFRLQCFLPQFTDIHSANFMLNCISQGYDNLRTLCLHTGCYRSSRACWSKLTQWLAATTPVLCSWSVPGLLFTYQILVHRHQARHSVESPMKIVDVSCTENRVYAFSSKIASLHPISSLLPSPEYLIHCSTYTYCLHYGSEWPLQRKAKYQLKFWGIKYNNEFVFFNFSLKLICYLSYECLKLLFLMHVYIYILFQIVIS